MKQYAGKKILVEGWRDIPHSYAVANQFQCLDMLRRTDIELRHRDMPYFSASWKPMPGLFDPAREQSLRGMMPPQAGERFDAVLRMDFPHRVEPAGMRTCIFMTCEFGRIESASVAARRSLAQSGREVIYIAPSEWSRRGILETGVGAARVVVVPLGVDPDIFHPLEPEARRQVRRRMGLAGFTFIHFGAMTGNKNVPLLLKAFAAVTQRHPDCRLILKGLESLYGSKRFVEQSGTLLTPADIRQIESRLIYTGNTLPYSSMAEMYQAADAYVAPYGAEGFNLPVLEAIACGTPVICTAGGPTDDFTAPDFALRIESRERPCALAEGKPGIGLEPSLDHLIAHMLAVIENPAIGERARTAGPLFVAKGFLWPQTVERLLAVMLE